MRIDWIEKYMMDAQKLVMENQVQEGLNILDGLLFEEPGYGSLHNHLGWVHLYYTHDLQRAEVHLQAAVKFDAQYAPPYLHLGSLYMRLNKFAEAARVFENGARLASADKSAMLEGLARAQEGMQDYKAAMKSYREAAMASLNDGEMKSLTEGIRRCRKKRLMRMLGAVRL